MDKFWEDITKKRELEEQNKRLYCDSPPTTTAEEPKNVPMTKPEDITIRQDEIKRELGRNYPSQDRGISGCAKDNWFWIMIGIAGTLIVTIISNNEIGWIPKEVWAEYIGGGLFYLLYGIAHIAPAIMIFFGSWGMKSYCNTKACNRDHFTLVASMILITVGILITYFVINAHQENSFTEMWEMKDRMVGYALEDMK